MTKSKPSSRTLARRVLLLVSLFSLILSGCKPIVPTYKEKDIPFIIKKICKEEYKLDVTTQRTNNTIWIYAPLDKILSKDYGIKEDKIFDEEIMDKFRNIITTVGRVLISSDNTPEFFAFLASDINLGIDYTMIGDVLDIKKSYADFIPWTEANRRYVVKFKVAPEAVGDNTGSHFTPYDVKMTDFLSEQIAQRIGAHFQSEELKNYFKVDRSEGKFNDGKFSFDYLITQTANPNKPVDIQNAILDIASYCLKTYEFTSFSEISLTDLNTLNKLDFSKRAILTRPGNL